MPGWSRAGGRWSTRTGTDRAHQYAGSVTEQIPSLRDLHARGAAQQPTYADPAVVEAFCAELAYARRTRRAASSTAVAADEA